MSAGLSVADIGTYLAATGWRRQPMVWTSVSVWADAAGREAALAGFVADLKVAAGHD